jgi:hypothetical protein
MRKTAFPPKMLNLFFLSLFIVSVNALAVEVKGLVKLNYVKSDQQSSWFESDTGILAYS